MSTRTQQAVWTDSSGSCGPVLLLLLLLWMLHYTWPPHATTRFSPPTAPAHAMATASSHLIAAYCTGHDHEGSAS